MILQTLFQAAIGIELFLFMLGYFPAVTVYQLLVSKLNPSNSLATTTTTTAAPIVYCSTASSCGICTSETDTSGVIQSINYPAQYSTNLDCVYTITAPTGSVITLTFNTFDVELCCDFVSVLDGTTPLQVGMSGYSIPGPFKTTNNTMYVVFTSSNDDSTIVGTGAWQATYTFSN